MFTAEFKRTTVARVQSGETTLAAVSRELDIQPTVIRRWIKLSEGGRKRFGVTSVATSNTRAPRPMPSWTYFPLLTRGSVTVLGRFTMATVIMLITSTVSPAPPETLQVALYPYVPDRRGLFHELETIFEREHPGVNLELVETDDFVKHYYDGGLLNTDADVYEIDTILLSDMVEDARLAVLNLPDVTFAPATIESVTRHGKTYAVPHWLCGNFLFYRKGDAEIENVRTWGELNQLLSRRQDHLLVDFKGKSTLGEWYLTVVADLHGFDWAQEQVIKEQIDLEAVSLLRHILGNCPPGFCRSDELHERAGFYSRAFVAGVASAYVGYSETLHYGLQYALTDCLPTSGCLSKDEIAVRRLPAFAESGHSDGVGWVDALAVSSKLSQRKKELAMEFIEFAVSERAYRVVLEPEWRHAPRYLLPARSVSGITDALLYPQFFDAHALRKTGTRKELNTKLRKLGEQLDCALPIERTDSKTRAACAGVTQED